MALEIRNGAWDTMRIKYFVQSNQKHWSVLESFLFNKTASRITSFQNKLNAIERQRQSTAQRPKTTFSTWSCSNRLGFFLHIQSHTRTVFASSHGTHPTHAHTHRLYPFFSAQTMYAATGCDIERTNWPIDDMNFQAASQNINLTFSVIAFSVLSIHHQNTQDTSYKIPCIFTIYKYT